MLGLGAAGAGNAGSLSRCIRRFEEGGIDIRRVLGAFGKPMARCCDAVESIPQTIVRKLVILSRSISHLAC